MTSPHYSYSQINTERTEHPPGNLAGDPEVADAAAPKDALRSPLTSTIFVAGPG